VLAEPTLVTLSGRPAFCHIGGEVPAPVTREDGTVAVEYREYGTRIDLVPIVLEGGRMRLELRARVGQIDPTRSVEVEGQTCPGLIVREVDTGVEMRAGQTLILGGLVRQRSAGSEQEPSAASEAAEAEDSDGEPATGEEESELLVLVEPQIVYPLKQELSPCHTGQPVPHGGEFPAARAIPLPPPGATR
jgi:pilus assembly protein CpaC